MKIYIENRVVPLDSSIFIILNSLSKIETITYLVKLGELLLLKDRSKS